MSSLSSLSMKSEWSTCSSRRTANSNCQQYSVEARLLIPRNKLISYLRQQRISFLELNRVREKYCWFNNINFDDWRFSNEKTSCEMDKYYFFISFIFFWDDSYKCYHCVLLFLISSIKIMCPKGNSVFVKVSFLSVSVKDIFLITL